MVVSTYHPPPRPRLRFLCCSSLCSRRLPDNCTPEGQVGECMHIYLIYYLSHYVSSYSSFYLSTHISIHYVSICLIIHLSIYLISSQSIYSPGEISPLGVVHALLLLTATATMGSGVGGGGEHGSTSLATAGQEPGQGQWSKPTNNTNNNSNATSTSARDHVRLVLQLAHREGLAGILALVCLPQV